MLSQLWTFIAALLPSAGLLYLFVMVIKHIVEGDRRERVAQRQVHLLVGMVEAVGVIHHDVSAGHDRLA